MKPFLRSTRSPARHGSPDPGRRSDMPDAGRPGQGLADAARPGARPAAQAGLSLLQGLAILAVIGVVAAIVLQQLR